LKFSRSKSKFDFFQNSKQIALPFCIPIFNKKMPSSGNSITAAATLSRIITAHEAAASTLSAAQLRLAAARQEARRAIAAHARELHAEIDAMCGGFFGVGVMLLYKKQRLHFASV
jgi:hypothetical protein